MDRIYFCAKLGVASLIVCDQSASNLEVSGECEYQHQVSIFTQRACIHLSYND